MHTTHLPSPQSSAKPEIISFQTIRRAVGWLGISLPFALILGTFVFGGCCTLQPNISLYYYTNMREILVGVLCAVSLFMFTYKGFDKWDSIATNLAGFFSLGVAMFPTDCIDNPCQNPVVPPFSTGINATIHYVSAGLFFLTLACISLFLFTKSKYKDKKDRTPQKRKRNVVYIISGITIIACVLGIGLYEKIIGSKSEGILVFWLETMALIAFGISWLTKGEMLFGD